MHVCFATDGNGFQTRLLMTALDSLRRSASMPSDYFVHILCDTGGREALSPELVRYLDAFFPKSGFAGNDYIDVGKWARDKFKFIHDGWSWGAITVPSWFRFAAPFFIDADRIVYFDTDIVVLRDLRGLFSEDMKGAAAGVVHDFGMEFLPNVRENCLKRKLTMPPRNDMPYIGDSLILFDRDRFVSSGIVGRMAEAAPAMPTSCVHDLAVFSAAVRADEVMVLPARYHAPMYGMASSNLLWMDPLEQNIWNTHGSTYHNLTAFLADCVSVQMQGPKDRRYFDDPVLGPMLKERWDNVTRFCFGTCAALA